MFFLYRLTQTHFPMTFDLAKNEPVTMARIDAEPLEAAMMNNNQNWVTFANYSYGNLGNMMVLYPHSLSLIHVEIPHRIS